MLNRVIELIDKFYTRETRDEFYSRFTRAGFDKYFKIPLLSLDGKYKEAIVSNLGDIKFPQISRLRIDNISNKSITILGTTQFTTISLAELFHEFISISHHALRLNHYREFIDYYAPIYSGNRYFFFHGDGFCTLLAMLFQGLCKEKLGIDIDAMYCRTENFLFSHGYCRYVEENKITYIDPDLKDACNYKEFLNFQPASWFLNFIENIGIRVFRFLDPREREWMFYQFSQDYFVWLLGCCYRELSKPGSDYQVTYKLLHDSVPSFSEVIDVNSDDYSWKAKYRNAAKKIKDVPNHYFMHDLDRPVEFNIPAKGSFEVNPDLGEFKEYIVNLMTAYFGRIPGKFSFKCLAGEKVKLSIPEVPWLITFSNDLESVLINQRKILLRKNKLGKKYFAGMGDLDLLFNDLLFDRQVCFECSKDAEVSIFIPLNACLWNSNLIKLESNTQPPDFCLKVEIPQYSGENPGII